MMRWPIVLCVGLLAFAPLCGGQETQPSGRVVFYVAPAGNDANPGTAQKPFATISHARDAVRSLRHDAGGALKTDVLILLRGGVYTLAQPVVLDAQDSGNDAHSITYAAYQGERPVISGSPVLKPVWKKVPPATAPSKDGQGYVLWTAELPRGTWFEELFINDKRQTRARYPATGFINARDTGKDQTTIAYDAAKVHIPGDNLADSKLRATAMFRTYEWDEEQLPVATIDSAAGKITLAKAASYPIVPKGYGSVGQFALENLPGAICAAGQWALDGNGVLTCSLEPDADPNRLEFRGGSNIILFDLRGNASKAGDVENVHFRGLHFTQTGRTSVEWGRYEGQAIRMQGDVRNCSIRDCTFEDLGGGGVTLWRACQKIIIAGNEFGHIGDSAILVFNYLGEGKSESGNNEIIDNEIHDCGLVRRNANGIEIDQSGSNRVAHNDIHDMPYIGICVNGAMPTSWQQKSEPSLAPPFTAERIRPYIQTQNNLVEFNHLQRTMQVMSDGGAIYFWGTMGIGPNEVNNNLIEDVGPAQSKRSCVGIYMDDYTNDVQIRNNIVLHAMLGLHLHGTPRILLENNIFAFSTVCDCSIQPEKYNTPPMGIVIRRNIFYMGTGRLNYEYTDWSEQPVDEMNYNCWWRLPEGAKLKLGFGHGWDKDSLVADPMFIHPDKPQDGLRPDSPAIVKLGFKPIDVSRVGRR